jgi:hypothetical protein
MARGQAAEPEYPAQFMWSDEVPDGWLFRDRRNRGWQAMSSGCRPGGTVLVEAKPAPVRLDVPPEIVQALAVAHETKVPVPQEQWDDLCAIAYRTWTSTQTDHGEVE